MKRYLAVPVLLTVFTCAAPVASAQTTIRTDPEIQRLVAAVSADTIESHIRTLAGFYTRHTLSEDVSDDRGIRASARWIHRTLSRYAAEGGGHMQVEMDEFLFEADGRRIDRDVILENVIATLPGTDPTDDRIFLVSGHYDSRVGDIMDAESYAPGANDDASGTAAAMEIARVLAGERFPATLMFAAVTAEEQGLIGAEHIARRADSLGWNIAGMITLDIIGNTLGDDGTRDNRRVRLFSEGVPAAETEEEARLRQRIGGENDGPSRQFARYLKEVGERYVPHMDVWLIYRRDRFLRGGDHIPFNQLGFTAVRFTEPNEAFTRQHQEVRVEDGVEYGDVPDRVDFEYVADVTRINLAGLVNLAKSPPPPRNVGIDARGLDPHTTLRWEPPAGGAERIDGYFILIRDTASPVWERKFWVGDVTEYTVEGFSKDNYFFGVQSASPEGHESEIVFPRPVFR